LRAQHNSDYVQYMFNGMLLNPAYAGSHEALNLTALYRRQWVGIPGSPVTRSFTGHTAFKNKHYNAGLVIENEHVGLFSHTRAGAAFAYRFRLFNGKLALGLQAGLNSYSYNWGQLSVADSEDPVFTGVASRQTTPDGAAGIFYSDSRFYLGVAAQGLMKGSPDNLLLHSGYLLRAGEHFRLKPSVLLKYTETSPVFINASATVYYKEYAGLGGGYTLHNSWMVFLDLRLNDQLNMGYGYQRQLNELSTYTAGSHEIMIRYLFRYRIKAPSARYF
jgi:type IX secretion system PorP/SprF family membrane protein